MRRLPSTSEEEAWSVLAKINKTVINFCNITVTHYHDHDHVHLYRSGESTIIIITVNVMIGVLGYVLLRLSHQLWKSSLWPNKHSFMESLLNNWPWAPGLSTYYHNRNKQITIRGMRLYELRSPSPATRQGFWLSITIMFWWWWIQLFNNSILKNSMHYLYVIPGVHSIIQLFHHSSLFYIPMHFLISLQFLI